MIRFVAKLVVVALSTFTSTEALAQNVIPADIRGQPLVYVKEGNINGCGVRFIIVDTPPNPRDGSMIATYDVSFNLYRSGVAIIKGGSSDATWAQFMSGDVSKVRKLIAPSSLWLKAEGVSATRPLRAVEKSEDPGFIFYQSDLDPALALFKAFLGEQPILAGTKRPGAKSERVFSGVIAVEPAERERVGKCLAELLAEIKK